MEPYPFKKEELKVQGSKNIYKAFLSPKKLDTINQARNILNIVSHTFQILKKKTLQKDETILQCFFIFHCHLYG